ncbi:hypothetical protein MRX96_044728 [Rhipicephalus microplus]
MRPRAIVRARKPLTRIWSRQIFSVAPSGSNEECGGGAPPLPSESGFEVPVHRLRRGWLTRFSRSPRAARVAAQFGNDTATKSAFLFSPEEECEVSHYATQAEDHHKKSAARPAAIHSPPRKPAAPRWRGPCPGGRRLAGSAPTPSLSRPRRVLCSSCDSRSPRGPPAYSLDGFVPKPSIIRITTTEAPPHIRKMYASPKTEAPPFRKNAPRFGSKKSKTKPLTNDYDDDGHFRKGRKHHDSGGRKGVQRIMGSRGPRKGIPGVDYPNFHRIPTTGFDCNDKQFPGMYADPDAGCQVWHMCTGVPNLGARHSFLCPNGTIFNERRGVCDWWYNVECSEFTL